MLTFTAEVHSITDDDNIRVCLRYEDVATRSSNCMMYSTYSKCYDVKHVSMGGPKTIGEDKYCIMNKSKIVASFGGIGSKTYTGDDLMRKHTVIVWPDRINSTPY